MHAAYSLRAYNHSMLDDEPGQPIAPHHASARHNSVHCLVEFETKMPESLTKLTAESEAVGAVNAVRRCAAAEAVLADADKKLKKKAKKMETKAKKAETMDCDACHERCLSDVCESRIKKMHAEIAKLAEDNAAIKAGNDALKAENQRLQAEHQASLKAERHAKDKDVRLIKSAHDTALDVLNEEMAKIKAERGAMESERKAHAEELAALAAKSNEKAKSIEKFNRKLKEENARLRSEDLERSGNSLCRLQAEHSTEMAGLRERHEEALAGQFAQHQQRVNQIADLHKINLEDLHVRVADTSEQLSDANTKCNSLTAKLEDAQEVIRDLVSVCEDHKKLLGTVHDMLRVTAERLPSHLKCCLLDTQRSLQTAIQRIDFE